MHKLKLNVEDLAVASFTTETTAEGRGTVHGASASGPNSGDCGSTAWYEWVWNTTFMAQ